MSTYPRPHEVYASFNLPIIQPAVNEGCRNLLSPYRLVQFGALSVACLACQPLVNVRLPRGHAVPTSLFTLLVARSGEGKTAAESVFKRGVCRFEEAERAKYASAWKEYKEQLELFDVTRQALAAGVRRAIADGGDVAAAEEALLTHVRAKPVQPKLVRVCYDDVTPEAWLVGMADNFPASALFSSEAAAILNGRAFADLEKLNQAWSSGTLSADRKTQRSVYLAWCRVMLALMIQPDPLARYLEGKGKKAKGLGFWARALVCDPGSTQGTRLVYDGTLTWAHCDVFAARVFDLLTKAADLVGKEGYEPEVLEFSPEAAAHWFYLHNWYEEQIRPGGRYEGASDHASKLSDNIARVAAVLHYFEGFDGPISVETLNIAQVLCDDASMDYLRVFVPPPREFQDAQELNEWFNRYRKQGAISLPKNFARKHCPNALRSEGRFYIALEVLKQHGVVAEYLDAKLTAHINLNVGGAQALPWGNPSALGYRGY